MCANLSFSKKSLQNYEVISVLGSGSFGTCYKVRDRESNKLYAWKSIDYDEVDDVKLESLVAEIAVLRQLQHPNIVRYYHHLNSNEAKSIFIIMEWCANGDLSQLIAKARLEQKRFSEQYIWRVLHQICKALQVCHTKLKQGTVLHRDIKPANIFLDANWNTKLGDFGLARLVQRSERFANSIVGTPYYMSPEILKHSCYDSKSDVWALGCLIYEIAALRRPFNGKRIKQLTDNILAGNYANISAVYSEELRNLISFMLITKDIERPSIEMVARHPSLAKNITSDLSLEPLVVAEQDFRKMYDHEGPRQQLEYSFSSVDESCHELGRRLSVSGVFTPDLRDEIFYSANRLMSTRALQQSDSELYKTVRRCDERKFGKEAEQCPQHVSQKVFNELLRERLHAIRAQEALLKRKEEDLIALELKLNAKECRLRDLQQKLDKKQTALEHKIRNFKQINRRKLTSICSTEKSTNIKPATKRSSLAASLERKNDAHDETYCTIEPQDFLPPTVAKLNLNSLPASKSLTNLKKVTFRSPKRIASVDQENKPPTLRNAAKSNTRSSICSSSDGSNSDCINQRRRSFLSLLGIKRNCKDQNMTNVAARQHQTLLQSSRTAEVLMKCGTEKLTNVWTKENKRAAFDLLAAMKATDNSTRASCSSVRHSMRDSARDKLHHERMRQSMRIFPLAVETK